MVWRLFGYPIAGAYVVHGVFGTVVAAAHRRRQENTMIDEVRGRIRTCGAVFTSLPDKSIGCMPLL